jgi:small subunit ribosomal protein S17
MAATPAKKPAPAAAKPAPREPLTGTKVGVVTSDKRTKTRKVEISFTVKQPKYGKYLRRTSVFQVHDEKNESKVGDRVEIANCRPISKTKSWRLVKVLEKAPAAV